MQLPKKAVIDIFCFMTKQQILQFLCLTRIMPSVDKSVKRITRGSDVISVQDEVLYYVFNGKLCQYDLNAQTNSQVQNGPDLLEYDLIDPDSFYTVQNKYFVGCRLSVFAYSDSHSFLTYTTIYDLQHGKKYLFMGNLGRIAKNFQILNAD